MVWWQILLIILAVVVVILAVLGFFGRRLQKKADSQQGMIDAAKQTMSILVIDKKKLKMKDSNLPKMVQDQVPAYLKWRKMPLVKAKIGPKITTLMCDERIFKDLPVKKMVKVELAGMYIVGIKGANRPKKAKNEAEEPKKQSLLDRAKGMIKK